MTNRVILFPQDLGDETLQEVERQARAILDTLPHTPLTALGNNFRFLERSPSPELLRLFDITDRAELATAGFETNGVEIMRHLSYETDGVTVNFKLSADSDGVGADFNFNRVVSDRPAGPLLENTILADRDRAIRLLTTAYALELTTEGADL